MYFYYGLASIGIKPTWKKMVTTLQIVQFYFGLFFSLVYLLIPGLTVDKQMGLPNLSLSAWFPQRLLVDRALAQKMAIGTMAAYLCGLLILFTKFYNREYENKKKMTMTREEGEKEGKGGKAIEKEKKLK